MSHDNKMLVSKTQKPKNMKKNSESDIIKKYISKEDIVLELGAPSWGKSTLLIASMIKNFSLIACDPACPFSKKETDEKKFYSFGGFISDNIILRKKNKTFAKNFKKDTVNYDNLWSRNKLNNSYIFKNELDEIMKEKNNFRLENYYESCDIMKFKDIKENYNLDINTLVLDCEGGFYDLLKNSENIFENIYKIIIEWDDFSDRCFEIRNLIFDKGFVSVFQSVGWAGNKWHPHNIGHEVFILKEKIYDDK